MYFIVYYSCLKIRLPYPTQTGNWKWKIQKPQRTTTQGFAVM